jgi:ribosomal protein S18 acetylase RimI-like enzyme
MTVSTSCFLKKHFLLPKQRFMLPTSDSLMLYYCQPTYKDSHMLTFRPYTADDLDRVIEITLAAWEPVFASFLDLLGTRIFNTVYPDWRAEKIQQLTSQCSLEHGETIFVAVLNGKVVGYAVTYCNHKTTIGEISHNAVDPTYQNQGIATEMYARCLDEMKAKGMTCAHVSTGGDSSHAPARRAYEKAGFDRFIPSVNYFRKL